MRKIVKIDRPTVAQKRFEVGRLAALLEEAYQSTRREPHDRAKKSFAPSGVGYGPGMCPRRWFYDFNGGVVREDEVDAVSIANMAYGTEAHERIQGLFEKAGILIEAERTVELEDPPIFGFADLVIDWQGSEVVGEIKTTMQESFVSKHAKQKAAGYHLLQVLLYMHVLGLEKGFLLYENKNMQDMLIIPVTWNAQNKKLIDETLDWMRMVRKNWEDGNLPKRPFRSNSRICKQCPFTAHCWSDEQGVVDLPKLEVPE